MVEKEKKNAAPWDAQHPTGLRLQIFFFDHLQKAIYKNSDLGGELPVFGRISPKYVHIHHVYRP